MKRFLIAFTLGCILSGLAVRGRVVAQDAETASDGSKLRVGTFDSRLVATAYARSEMFKQRLAKMHADLEEAKARGAEELVKQLETEGQDLQDLFHKQGFSTWPVHNILQTIKAKIPEIAKQAEVDVIVSKWDVVFQRNDAETVYVTDLLVAPFAPSEETRRVLNSLRITDSVPIEKIERRD